MRATPSEGFEAPREGIPRCPPSLYSRCPWVRELPSRFRSRLIDKRLMRGLSVIRARCECPRGGGSWRSGSISSALESSARPRAGECEWVGRRGDGDSESNMLLTPSFIPQGHRHSAVGEVALAAIIVGTSLSLTLYKHDASPVLIEHLFRLRTMAYALPPHFLLSDTPDRDLLAGHNIDLTSFLRGLQRRTLSPAISSCVVRHEICHGIKVSVPPLLFS